MPTTASTSGMELTLRGSDNDWSLIVSLSSLDEAAAILQRMGTSGQVRAAIEVPLPDGAGFIRKGEITLGSAAHEPPGQSRQSPWSEASVPPKTPPPAMPTEPVSFGAAMSNAGRQFTQGVAQVFVGIIGLVIFVALASQLFAFVETSASRSVSAAPAPAAASSRFVTPTLHPQKAAYLEERIEGLAMVLRYGHVCKLSEMADMGRDTFVNSIVRAFELVPQDQAYIAQRLDIAPSPTCDLTSEELMAVATILFQYVGEGTIRDAFSAFGDAMAAP